ncbi:hypothetical protein F4775DRAFT_502053 [Biscogniauxia sp. FL1348]|nr:hypothetical protein F4775DRAFT_502053 [Biscogniauxia sp. FL1348]
MNFQFHRGPMPIFPELSITQVKSLVERLSMGLMLGTSIFYPNIKYKDPFYHYLTLGIFSISFFVHSILHWEAIKRYTLLASVMAITPVGVLFYQTDLPASFFSDRIPLLVMFSSLMTMCLGHYLERDLATRHPFIRFPPVDRPGPAMYGHGHILPRTPDHRPRPEARENDALGLLIAFMHDTEQGIMRPQSERSSDITLHSNGLESLPYSWDSDTRGFFPEYRNQADHQPVDEHERSRIYI